MSNNKHVNDLTIDEFTALIQKTVKETIAEEIEDMIALSSPSYIQSVNEARAEYKTGKVKSFNELFPDV